MDLKNTMSLKHMVAAHCGEWLDPNILKNHVRRMQDGVCYENKSTWNDADDADAFIEAVRAEGHSVECYNEFVKGVYTLFFTIS